jgi:tRNA dimethylallyltransferase
MDKSEKNKSLIVLVGPTGVGKTEISLQLAEMLNCPIVSSDSRQFYRELKIGTAAPTEDQLQRAKHYFIGSHSIFDEYNAGQYEQDVLQLLEKIFRELNAVLLVGGSMMYIDAVCRGMDEIPTVDNETRTFWMNQYQHFGIEYLQQELKRMDPVHFEEVDLKNPKRILHALEICTITGKPYSDLRTGQSKTRPFNIIKIGLNRPRIELYERINKRVDNMIQDGLIDEAKQFYHNRHLNTLNTVGYKELFQFFDGTWTQDFALTMIKQDSRRYAKRQLTWFNRDKDIHWFYADDTQDIIDFVKNKIDFPD